MFTRENHWDCAQQKFSLLNNFSHGIFFMILCLILSIVLNPNQDCGFAGRVNRTQYYLYWATGATLPKRSEKPKCCTSHAKIEKNAVRARGTAHNPQLTKHPLSGRVIFWGGNAKSRRNNWARCLSCDVSEGGVSIWEGGFGSKTQISVCAHRTPRRL